jgi:hypothetical protein
VNRTEPTGRFDFWGFVKGLTTAGAGVATTTSAFAASVGLAAVAVVPLGLVVISVRGILALFAIGSNASTIPVG